MLGKSYRHFLRHTQLAPKSIKPTLTPYRSYFTYMKPSQNLPSLFTTPRMAFSEDESKSTATGTQGKMKVTARTLADICGTRYYPHNEEVTLAEVSPVLLFDEHDNRIGTVNVEEAREIARSQKKDFVLRNEKSVPPVAKIMNYRKELFKRLFQKMGKDTSEIDETSFKTIRISTNIAISDLEAKKHQAIKFLKSHHLLKFYMTVNQYDPENVQKGRIMLNNIANDLKEYSKIRVSPLSEEDVGDDFNSPTGEKKPTTAEGIEKLIDETQAKQDDIYVHEREDIAEDEDERNLVFMELQSTVALQGIDIDHVLETADLDEFFQTFYMSDADSAQSEFLKNFGVKAQAQEEEVVEKKEEEVDDSGSLFGKFGAKQKIDSDQLEAELERHAIESLRKTKQSRQKSRIFSMEEASTQDFDEDHIDMRDESEETEDEDALIDDLDLLDVDVNPLDFKTMAKKQMIQQQIAYEVFHKKCKILYKATFTDEDPFNIRPEEEVKSQE